MLHSKPRFEAEYLGENILNLLEQKVAKMLPFLWATKNHNNPQKVAQLVRNRPIWAP